MPRLNAGSLGKAPADVRRPAYDRSRMRVGLAHIGVGAFHRCHQAEYTDDVLAAGADDRCEVAVSIRPPSIEDQLVAQDGLFTRVLVDGDEADFRVIGAIARVIDAERSREKALAALADPGVDVISMTVTEKGYCHVPATGELDPSRADIAADLARPGERATLPGFLVDVLARRMAARAPVTLLSCDNIPHNGRILRQVISGFAAEAEPALAGWIADNVRFPSTMVDRIVPATSAADLARVREHCGYADAGTVVGEPFRQWVIEDDFNRPRPCWDAVGAEFVGDVEPYEFVKMRVLNACQTALSYLGALSGHATSYDDVCDPLLKAFAGRMVLSESIEVLPVLPGMEVPAYAELTFRRLGNPAIRHTNHQIATDGSQKINQRILQPLRDRAVRGLASPLLETAVAAWLAYLARSQPAFGARWQASDPLMPLVEEAARASGGNAEAFARSLIADRAVFGDRLSGDDGFAGRVENGCAQLLAEGVAPVLAGRLGIAEARGLG